MAVDEQRFFRLLKLQAGERFFPGRRWLGGQTFLCVNHHELGFSKFVFFLGGKMSSKKPGKDVGSWNSNKGFIWGISTILMEARVKIQVNQSTFPLRIWTLEGLHAWTGCFFCGNIGRMKASVNIYTSYTDALEGLRHDLAYMGTTTSVLQMQQIRYWNGRKLHEKDIQHLLKPLQYC